MSEMVSLEQDIRLEGLAREARGCPSCGSFDGTCREGCDCAACEEDEGEPLPEYGNALYAQFVEDMRAAGLKPWDYRGRFYYHGPAVSVGDLQDALSATEVECRWDSLGLGYVVYPR